MTNIKSSTISGGKGASLRREFDFYSTPKEVTLCLLNFLQLEKTTIIGEPACGEGHISRVIESLGLCVMSSDIRHTGYGTGGIDYLNTKMKFDAIITNPPFNIAEQFIRKAIGEAPVVAMLLKAHYWHAAKRYNLFKQREPAYVLPLTWRPNWIDSKKSSSPTMDFQWTVWMPGSQECKYIPLKRINS